MIPHDSLIIRFTDYAHVACPPQHPRLRLLPLRQQAGAQRGPYHGRFTKCRDWELIDHGVCANRM